MLVDFCNCYCSLKSDTVKTNYFIMATEICIALCRYGGKLLVSRESCNWVIWAGTEVKSTFFNLFPLTLNTIYGRFH